LPSPSPVSLEWGENLDLTFRITNNSRLGVRERTMFLLRRLLLMCCCPSPALQPIAASCDVTLSNTKYSKGAARHLKSQPSAHSWKELIWQPYKLIGRIRTMKSRVLLAALIGFVIGTAMGVAVSAIYTRRSASLFGNRLRCRTIAEEYVSKSLSSPLLDQVNYSPTRNSCVASMHSHYLGFWRDEVVDVVSNETIYTGECNYDGGKCGGGLDIKLEQDMEQAFHESVGR
jgi:hypothetical protein